MSRQIVAVHKALQTRLAAALAGQAGVYTNVPRDAALPYVQIGQHLPTPQDDLDALMTQHVVTVTVFSAYPGMSEVLTLIEAIESALHLYDLPLESGQSVACRFLRGDVAPQDADEDANGAEASFIGSAIIEVISQA